MLEVDVSLPKKKNLSLRNNESKEEISFYNSPVDKTVERARYARMSPQQFKEYFENEVDEARILEKYELFASQGFRVFARSLPSYEKFICCLSEKIKKDASLKKSTAFVEGFDYSFFLWWENS
jgi:hypothetical protein